MNDPLALPDPDDITIEDGDIVIPLSEAWFTCTRCGSVKPEGERDSSYHMLGDEILCDDCLRL
jgi:hypothetical protein